MAWANYIKSRKRNVVETTCVSLFLTLVALALLVGGLLAIPVCSTVMFVNYVRGT